MRVNARGPVGIPVRDLKPTPGVSRSYEGVVAAGAPLVYRNVGNIQELESARYAGYWTAARGGFTAHAFEGDTQFAGDKDAARRWSHPMRNQQGKPLIVEADISGLPVRFIYRPQNDEKDTNLDIDPGGTTGVFHPDTALGIGVVGPIPLSRIKNVWLVRDTGDREFGSWAKFVEWRERFEDAARNMNRRGKATPMRARALGHLPGGIPARVAAKADRRYRVQCNHDWGTHNVLDGQSGHRTNHQSHADAVRTAKELNEEHSAKTGSTGMVKTADDDQCPYCLDDGVAIGGKEYRCQGCGRTFPLGGFDVTVATTKTAEADTAGVMVCLIPEHDASIALMEASNSSEEFDEQHITLLYLGSTEDAGGEAGRERLHRAVYDFAIHSGHDVLSGKANGWGTFNNPEQGESVLVALWDIPGIAEFRAALKKALTDHGVPMREEDHGFTPHQTMAYLPGATTQIPGPVQPAPESVFTHVVISWGDEWSSVALESALGAQQQQVAASLRALGFDERFDPTKHPRGGNPGNPGQFSRAPGGGRGTVVPDSKKPQRTKTKDQQAPQQAPETPKGPSPADMPQQRQQAPKAPAGAPPHEVAQRYGVDVSYRPKGPAYRGVSDEVFWRQVERGDVFGMHIPEGEFPKGDPRNEPEYKARAAKVEALADKYVSVPAEEARRSPTGGTTDALHDQRYNPKTKKNDLWDPEREKVHDKILADFIAKATKGVPREGKCLIMAGPSGAGKSTFLQQQGHAIGVQMDSTGKRPVNFAVINPDDFKDDVPVDLSRYPGLNANELAGIKHEESSHLAMLATQALMSRGYNVIMDVTLGNASKAQEKYVDGDWCKGYHDYTVALVDGDMANSRQNAGNRYKVTDKKTGERQWTGRFIPMGLVDSQKPKDPSRFRSVNAEQFMIFSQLPQVTRAVVFDPYNTKQGLQEAKSAIHEAIRRNPALASMIRVGAEGGPQRMTTQITERIRAFKAGQIDRAALVRFLTEEFDYKDPEPCPHQKGTPEWYRWHEDRPYVPGSFAEVRYAQVSGLLPRDVYREISQILWDGAEPAGN